MEDIWLNWAKRLHSIASTGLYFGTGKYDLERYKEVADIANEMLTNLGNVPVASIEGLFADFAQDYATPKVDVRGAVFRDEKILLVQEASDNLWTLPGGYADVGLSPGENIVKEIWEEASIRVVAKTLYSVRHKAKHDYDADARDFYKLFFICDRLDEIEPAPGPETVAAEFFHPAELPSLSTGRVIREDIMAALEYRRDTSRLTMFD